MAPTKEHLLILGASGASGLALLEQVLRLGDSAPLLTLYIRASGRSKLPKTIDGQPNIRIVEGALSDRKNIAKALSPDDHKSGFPKVTTVISFLGAYVSLHHLLTRSKPTPISEAFETAILPAMNEQGVKRIFALSTLSAFQYPEEARKMTWYYWFQMLQPRIIVPQGDAEMRGIANAVVVAGAQNPELEWTVYRVPYLTDSKAVLKISAGTLFEDFAGGTTLSRPAMVKWVLDELVERKHVRKAPLLGDVS